MQNGFADKGNRPIFFYDTSLSNVLKGREGFPVCNGNHIGSKTVDFNDDLNCGFNKISTRHDKESDSENKKAMIRELKHYPSQLKKNDNVNFVDHAAILEKVLGTWSLRSIKKGNGVRTFSTKNRRL